MAPSRQSSCNCIFSVIITASRINLSKQKQQKRSYSINNTEKIFSVFANLFLMHCSHFYRLGVLYNFVFFGYPLKQCKMNISKYNLKLLAIIIL